VDSAEQAGVFSAAMANLTRTNIYGSMGQTRLAVFYGEQILNEPRAYYSYQSTSSSFDYQDACGPFDTAIRFSVGMDPIMGGADDKVKEVCDACYENLKSKLQGKTGVVMIIKTRHPDGKQKVFLIYSFKQRR
jgi:hypothetical protein